MNDVRCEDVLLAKMAELDGETPALAAPEIGSHLERCSDCSREVEEMQRLDRVFTSQARTQLDIDVWPAVERAVRPTAARQIGWIPFAIVGALLVAYKFAELIPDRRLGLGFTMVPLALLAVLFFVLRENPFRVNSELTLER